MKTKQFIYPIPGNKIVLQNINCVQIGIEAPHSFPITELNTSTQDLEVVLRIQDSETGRGIDYIVTDKDILEFSYIYYIDLSITIIKTNNPYLIIDIGYTTAD